MAYVNYKNSPSEETPLTGGATGNLNVMQENGTSHGTDTKLGYAQSFLNEHIINVSNEVDEDYRVNFIHSRNLFTINSLLPNTALNNGVIFSSSEWDIFVIPVEIGTTYTLSKTSYNGGILSFNTTFPKINDTVNNAQTLRNISTLTFEAKDNYLCLMIAKSDDKTTIQVEKGSTATTYEEFIQNQIVVDNEKYSDTINVGSVVDSKSRVNVLYSHNLFNKNSFNKLNGYYVSESQSTISQSGQNMQTLYISIVGGKTYTVSKVAGVNFRCATTQVLPAPGVTVADQIDKNTATSITITTSLSAKYLCVSYYSNTETQTEQTILNSIMINEGSTVLPYEPYIVPSIYVDNEMLVSKNIYSSGEVVIGEWLGKPLYRKVIEITSPTLDAWASVNHNIANMDFGRIIDATLTRISSGTTSYIPIGIENVSSGALFTCNLQKTIFQYKIAVYTNITKLTAVLEYTKTTD